jgi:hypothetical protein
MGFPLTLESLFGSKYATNNMRDNQFIHNKLLPCETNNYT